MSFSCRQSLYKLNFALSYNMRDSGWADLFDIQYIFEKLLLKQGEICVRWVSSPDFLNILVIRQTVDKLFIITACLVFLCIGRTFIEASRRTQHEEGISESRL